MPDENDPSQEAEKILKVVVWRSQLRMSVAIEQFTTWTITGVAAIAGLLISNLDSVDKIVHSGGIRNSLILLTFSLIFGGLSKQIGSAVANGMDTISQLEKFLYAPEHQRLLTAIKTDRKRFLEELSRPWSWPLSKMMRAGGQEGFKDGLTADRKMIRLFCNQLQAFWLHSICAAGALFTLAFCIK